MKKKILTFLIFNFLLVISVRAQFNHEAARRGMDNSGTETASEYVKTYHYTYKCAYCKSIKKEDIVDIESIKNPEIAKNASTYAMASAMFGSAGSSGTDYCDISRTGNHRYELKSKTVTKELYRTKNK